MNPRADLRTLNTPALLAHIITNHHDGLRTAMPALSPLVAKVARVHGGHNPTLLELEKAFFVLRHRLDAHLEDEENILFRLVAAASHDEAALSRELDYARTGHAELGTALREIRALADDFEPPPWACHSYRTLLAKLVELEEDLLLHLHVEEEMLFPRLLEETRAV